MKPIFKVAIVVGGYLLAGLMALAAVALRAAAAGESGAPASDGMAAFGDLVLFAAVFGAVALVPTGLGLFFLFSRKRTPPRSTDPAVASGTLPAGPEPRLP